MSIAEELIGLEEGSNRAKDVGVGLGDFSGEMNGGTVDGFELICDAVCFEFESIGSKGIGFDEVGACLDIVAMNAFDEFGFGEAELLIAGVDENAFCVEHGAHCTIADEGVVLEGF